MNIIAEERTELIETHDLRRDRDPLQRTAGIDVIDIKVIKGDTRRTASIDGTAAAGNAATATVVKASTPQMKIDEVAERVIVQSILTEEKNPGIVHTKSVEEMKMQM